MASEALSPASTRSFAAGSYLGHDDVLCSRIDSLHGIGEFVHPRQAQAASADFWIVHTYSLGPGLVLQSVDTDGAPLAVVGFCLQLGLDQRDFCPVVFVLLGSDTIGDPLVNFRSKVCRS